MGDLDKDEIRTTLHVERELNDKFLEAYEKKTGKKFKKKSAYTEALRKYVKDNGVDVELESETPPVSTEIVTTDDMTYTDKEAIAKKLAEERQKIEQKKNLPPPFPSISNGKSEDVVESVFKHVPKDRKVRITRIEID